MIYGYARVSRDSQVIERQIKNLKNYNDDIVIYQETYKSDTTERPQFKKLLKVLKKDDTLILDSVSRFSRDSQEGKELYFKLVDRGIKLVFLKESDINSDVIKDQIDNALKLSLGNNKTELIKATEDYIKTILVIQAKEQVASRFKQAQKELEDIRQRTKEGIARVKSEGKKVGGEVNKGKTLITKKQIEMIDKINKMDKSFGGNMNANEVMETLGLSRNTYFKYKKIIKGEA